LNMGTRDSVSSLISAHRRIPDKEFFRVLQNHEIVD